MTHRHERSVGCPFHVGDVVVCVSDVWWNEGDAGAWQPKVGTAYTVAAVDLAFDDDPIIDLAEDPCCHDPDAAWEAKNFRKVERATDEFTEQMRAIKPARKSVSA